MAVAWVGLIAGDALVFHWGIAMAQPVAVGAGLRIVPEGRLLAAGTCAQGRPFYIFVIRFRRASGRRSFCGRFAETALPASVHLDAPPP
jgi:hypothetical protein